MSEKRLLPDPIVCRRYGVCSMTLWRWDHDPNLKFPKPVRIRGRKYRDQDELNAFDATQAGDGVTTTTKASISMVLSHKGVADA
jgi:hypothetical protein